MVNVTISFEYWEPSCCPGDHPGHYWTHHSEEVEAESLSEIDAQIEAWYNTGAFDRISYSEDY